MVRGLGVLTERGVKAAQEDHMPKRADGRRNRLADLRCGWRKGDELEREQFLRELIAEDEGRALVERLLAERDEVEDILDRSKRQRGVA